MDMTEDDYDDFEIERMFSHMHNGWRMARKSDIMIADQ